MVRERKRERESKEKVPHPSASLKLQNRNGWTKLKAHSTLNFQLMKCDESTGTR